MPSTMAAQATDARPAEDGRLVLDERGVVVSVDRATRGLLGSAGLRRGQGIGHRVVGGWPAVLAWARDGLAGGERLLLRGARGDVPIVDVARDGDGRVVLRVADRHGERGADGRDGVLDGERIFAAAAEPMFLVTADHLLVRANPALGKLMGVPDVAALAARRCHEAVFGLAAPCPGCLVGESLAEGKPLEGAPHREGAGDRQLWFDRRFIPLSADVALEVLADRSEAVRLAHRNTVTEQHARIGRIAASIAHDLRSSLLVISAAAEAMRETSEEQALELRGMILQEVQHLDVFSRDLLDFTASVPVQRDEFDLVALLEQAVASVEQLRGDLAIDVDACLERERWFVEGDHECVRRAVVNLLTNAAQFAGTDGQVAVVCGQDGREVWLRIEDDGPGVPRDIQRDIFEPFFTTRQGGTGLGLANARRFVELSGGAIGLVPPLKLRGASFEIRLPTARRLTRDGG